MREYAKVAPTFWTGETGRRIRGAGPQAQLVALYLITSPHANMLGLYYLPLPFLCHETGLDAPEARAALERLREMDFLSHDPEGEFVWIHEMARFQIGESLKPADKRVAGVARRLARLDTPLAHAFAHRYREAFHLPGTRSGTATGAASGGPPEVEVPLADGSRFAVSPALVEQLRGRHPQVDVTRRLTERATWCAADPARRPGPEQVNGRIERWLEKGPSPRGSLVTRNAGALARRNRRRQG